MWLWIPRKKALPLEVPVPKCPPCIIECLWNNIAAFCRQNPMHLIFMVNSLRVLEAKIMKLLWIAFLWDEKHHNHDLCLGNTCLLNVNKSAMPSGINFLAFCSNGFHAMVFCVSPVKIQAAPHKLCGIQLRRSSWQMNNRNAMVVPKPIFHAFTFTIVMDCNIVQCKNVSASKNFSNAIHCCF